jgi:hypothetical protein
MLVMSMVCAASGVLMDVRVMGLLARARAGTLLQQELDRADEIATILLLFTLVINAACLFASLAWVVRSTPGPRASMFVALAALAIPIANPVAAFMVRGYENGPAFAITAKLLGVTAAIAALVLIRRRNTRPLKP